MASSDRHRTNVSLGYNTDDCAPFSFAPHDYRSTPPAPSSDTPPASCSVTVASLDYPKGVPWDVADSVVRELLRIPPHPDSSQRGEPGPVANQRHSSPVGARILVDAKLALLGSRGLPNISRWP